MCMHMRARTDAHTPCQKNSKTEAKKKRGNKFFVLLFPLNLINWFQCIGFWQQKQNKNRTENKYTANLQRIKEKSFFFLFFSKVYRMECFSVGPIMQPIAVIHICFSVLFLKKATARKSHKTQSQQPINIFILPVKNIFILPVKNNSRMDR